MKFFYKTGGKTLAFIACILCAAIALAAGIGAGIMLSENYYTRSERAVYDDAIRDNLITDGDRAIWEAEDSGFCPVLLSDRGNLKFMILDENGKPVAISRGAKNAQLGYDPDSYSRRLEYLVLKNPEGRIVSTEYRGDGFRRAMEDDPELAEHFKDYVSYTVCFQLRSPFTANDAYAVTATWVHIVYALRWWMFVIALAFLLLGIWFFIILMRTSGRAPDGSLRAGPLDKVPFDLLLALCLLGAALLFNLVWEIRDDLTQNVFGCIGLGALACVGLGLCMSFAGRVKRNALWRNTLIYRILRGLWKLIGKLPLIWRTALIVLAVCLFEFLVIALAGAETDNLLICWFFEKLILVPAVLYLALGLRKLQAGGSALAAGDLSYQTDTKGLVWALKSHGENLNAIALGMNRAVEERLKSERMKTELITNVSHDLKTPLTSILNYSGLIAAEPCENEKITEYAQVLTRQSERLTRLIDDLVEASKASTGSLEVHLAPVEAQVLVQQAAGEYSERLRAAGLELVTKVPDTPIRILADGRRMWRIFDNLMNNIFKYALPGTRVYLSLEQMKDSAVISFKNTSSAPLDISEEELLERFVRGERSRTTEGNGLGLSIARSLAELQGGKLRLYIDGDLFKAILVFPFTGSVDPAKQAGNL